MKVDMVADSSTLEQLAKRGETPVTFEEGVPGPLLFCLVSRALFSHADCVAV
jgi:hypothetical protein